MRPIAFLLALFLTINLSAQSDIYLGSWSGTIEDANLELVFNINKEKPTFEVPSQGAKDIPMVVEETAVGIRLTIPMLMASFEGMCFGKTINGTYQQQGQKIQMTLKPYTPQIVSRPQTPKGPFAYSTQEVSFSNGPAVLAGTLTLPENASFDTPVLLFVTGSGAQDRDEQLMEHKPFWVLADALANAGIASLRYDDRGFAKSTGDLVMATTDTLAQDALQGLRYLRSLGYKNVGLLGHSEGGTIAFMLAAAGETDFIVSLAGMAETGKETILHQGYAIAKAQGTDEQTAESTARQLLTQMEHTNANAWTRCFLQLNPADYLKDVKCPLLALNGENDKNVIHEYNIPIIRELVPHAQIKTYPALNHLFQPSNNGTASEFYFIETTISPEVIADIIAFIKGL